MKLLLVLYLFLAAEVNRCQIQVLNSGTLGLHRSTHLSRTRRSPGESYFGLMDALFRPPTFGPSRTIQTNNGAWASHFGGAPQSAFGRARTQQLGLGANVGGASQSIFGRPRSQQMNRGTNVFNNALRGLALQTALGGVIRDRTSRRRGHLGTMGLGMGLGLGIGRRGHGAAWRTYGGSSGRGSYYRKPGGYGKSSYSYKYKNYSYMGGYKGIGRGLSGLLHHRWS